MEEVVLALTKPQAAKIIVNFAEPRKDTTMDKALLGWGDLVVKGPNEMFTGTLGETPQPNGIGGGTARPAIRTHSIRRDA